ncbi:hypothetical protein COV06_03865 [Candidatus Uhrbacteria bacterium CG10_big_fil_rev_8_21_14_0_10_50_16]|uniref:Sulfate transporter CysZ n=1 Tax=Candidatus Uhrbacteria bacterium CG10_big_fil_rev_8_21_14_0_10_50_16 TaxID=1975039 RepID=A0A2H0RLG9_9BACT|nr:MAG: hypothetical protein COV06_03865 [Candidatus Uhrbacteria bacterium CG10_big_fil_rev_8_21_14_0_10_50_16]
MKHLHQMSDGFFLLFRGARVMVEIPGAWWLLTIPILFNVGIFVAMILIGWQWIAPIVAGFLGASFESFWLVLLMWIVYLLFFFLVLLGYAFFFSLIAEVVGSPFYEELGARLEKQHNQVIIERPWYKEILFTITQESRKAVLLGVVVMIGFLLQFLPVVGQVLSGVLGFGVLLVTSGGDAVSPALARRGLMLGDRRRWVVKHLGPVLGLGTAKALGLLIPFFNIFVLPMSAAAGTLLVQKYNSSSDA